jgi:hypothetical protein
VGCAKRKSSLQSDFDEITNKLLPCTDKPSTHAVFLLRGWEKVRTMDLYSTDRVSMYSSQFGGAFGVEV